MTPHTKNFHPERDVMLRCTCGHASCDRRGVNQSTLDQLQLIRDDLGAAIVVMSGGRCPNHPDEVGRTDTDHQDCTTVDVECRDEQHETKLKVLAGRHGATRVAGGAYCDFVHMSWKETERRDIPTWVY